MDAEFCIVGLGPAGLGAALNLRGRRLLCFEAGGAAEERFCTILQGKKCRQAEPCEITGGIGGSAILSGGKVSTFPAGSGMGTIVGPTLDVELTRALDRFSQYVPLIPPEESPDAIRSQRKFFGDRGFDFKYYPAYRYRSADLVDGCRAMLRDIESIGAAVYLRTQVNRVQDSAEGGFRIFATSNGVKKVFSVANVIIACGRSGMRLMEDTDAALNLGRETQRCDVGVRLEFPSSIWPDIDQGHKDLKLHFGDARTFCVCKEGCLAPYRVNDIFLVEGHSDPDVRTGYTNLAITVRPKGSTLEGPAVLQTVRERLLSLTAGRPIRQRLADYLAERISTPMAADPKASISFWRWGDANRCLPEPLSSSVREAVRYFADQLLPTSMHEQVFIYAPELDYYWPKFRINRGFKCVRPGVFLIGDCSGHFRGILQAFCSGLHCGFDLSKGNV